ncbi:MAG: chromate resistance protein [Spirochaetales bacterium]|nr:chromate resistance protein [Spirochaetales bacterium]
MKWITRAHADLDRIATPWLIKRFIDSNAEFIFMAEDFIREEAEKTGAIPFDIKGSDFGPKGENRTFTIMMQKFHIKDPALDMMAGIINAACSDNMDSNPFASGITAIISGFSLQSPDDQENLETQFAVFDALYAYCKLKTAAAK